MEEEVKREDVVDGGGGRTVSDGGDDRRRAPTVARRTTGPTRRSTKGHWTPEEDGVLTEAVKRFNGKNWKCIAGLFKQRTDVQCLHRWQKVLNPELIKGAWTKEEDDLIIKLVEMHGCKNWSVVARSLSGRIGKQCRERWVNHLNPAIKKDAWTKKEETILIRAHKTYGNKWAEISKLLPGRSDNSIKNHWNCSLKKRIDREMPNIVLEISSHDLQSNKSLGHKSEARYLKSNPELQSNKSLDQKLNADGHSPTPNTSSIDEDTSVEKQDRNGPTEDMCSPLNGKAEIFFPTSCSPLQEENTADSISSENISGPDDYNKIDRPICYSTPPDLSLSLGCMPNSPVSILRRAAKSFETPSIIKRRNQSGRSVDVNTYDGVHDPSKRARHIERVSQHDCSHHVSKDKVGVHRSDIWSTEQFCHLSRDYLRLGNFGFAGYVGKRLEPEFDTEWDEDTSRQ